MHIRRADTNLKAGMRMQYVLCLSLGVAGPYHVRLFKTRVWGAGSKQDELLTQ